MLSVNIGIPAYNEEKNIASILNSITKQNIHGFKLNKIFVMSDGSSDNTNPIVQNMSKKNKKIILKINKKRYGKTYSINNLLKISKSDILILLDADVNISKKDFITKIVKSFTKDRNIGLVAGNPVPFNPKNLFNISEQASFFSWILLKKIKDNNKSIFSAHGRILALSKKFYKNLFIEDTPGDDQFIFLSCIKKGFEFRYVKEAIVYYKLPQTSVDYLKQNIRFRMSLKRKKEIFGNVFTENNLKINKILLKFIAAFFENPYKGFCWFILYSLGTISLINRKEANPIWDISKTTK